MVRQDRRSIALFVFNEIALRKKVVAILIIISSLEKYDVVFYFEMLTKYQNLRIWPFPNLEYKIHKGYVVDVKIQE